MNRSAAAVREDLGRKARHCEVGTLVGIAESAQDVALVGPYDIGEGTDTTIHFLPECQVHYEGDTHDTDHKCNREVDLRECGDNDRSNDKGDIAVGPTRVYALNHAESVVDSLSRGSFTWGESFKCCFDPFFTTCCSG